MPSSAPLWEAISEKQRGGDFWAFVGSHRTWRKSPDDQNPPAIYTGGHQWSSFYPLPLWQTQVLIWSCDWAPAWRVTPPPSWVFSPTYTESCTGGEGSRCVHHSCLAWDTFPLPCAPITPRAWTGMGQKCCHKKPVRPTVIILVCP